MEPNRRCPRCGTELTAGSLEELCPRCLLMAGLESGSAPALSPPTEAYSGSREALRPEELAPYFPQLEIIELLGKGGMGAVYKARQPGLDRVVALKILPPETGADPGFAERFRREAQALAKLNHPHIVGVYDFGQTSHGPRTPPGPPFERGGERGGGLYYFLMEYVDGVNLRQAMRAGGLKPAEALRIVPQVCDALQFAHDEGIVHRDVKPENILLDRKGRVKIADFGLAKLLGAKPDRALTHTQQAMGTPHYMAPEQIQGARDVDHRADIYSLGVTFYEMLTGELPLGRFAPPSKKVQIDVRLDEVVLRSLEVEPEKRFQHASDVKTEVETIGGVMGMSPLAMRHLFGKEYKSKTTIFGIPLLHIAFGLDPKTGKKRVAKGIIALGDIAVGGFACGGMAMGGVAFGGVSVGLVSLAGCALGLLLAVGGLAIGGVAFGGMAVGGVAIGGGAVGYYAAGGDGWGVHGMFAQVRDPVAVAFFESWAINWPLWLACLGIGIPLSSVLMFSAIWCVFRFLAPPANGAEPKERSGSTGVVAKDKPLSATKPVRRPLEESPWYNLGILIGFLSRIRFWPLLTCLAGAGLVFLGWNAITIRGNINRAGPPAQGLQVAFTATGYESWPGIVVAACFFLTVCVIVGTWSLSRPLLGRASFMMGTGLTVLLTSVFFLSSPPLVDHEQTNLVVKRILQVAPDFKVIGRSDADILREATRTMDLVITNVALASPYWTLFLGAALMLQGALELQRCLRAQAALAAADEWMPTRR